jgi:hypothetical protein
MFDGLPPGRTCWPEHSTRPGSYGGTKPLRHHDLTLVRRIRRPEPINALTEKLIGSLRVFWSNTGPVKICGADTRDRNCRDPLLVWHCDPASTKLVLIGRAKKQNPRLWRPALKVAFFFAFALGFGSPSHPAESSPAVDRLDALHPTESSPAVDRCGL